MKTKVYLIFFLGLLFLTTEANSQEKRFIEIVCSDTVLLNSTSFTYQISIGQQLEFMGMKLPQDKKENDLAPSISELENLLNKEQFTYNISYENDYSISFTKNSPVIYVELQNEIELKRLYQTLIDIEGISGKISNVLHEPVKTHYDEMYMKLYSNALSQAEIISKITDSNVGKLLSVSEVTTDHENYMDIYKQMMRNMPVNFLHESGLLKQKVERKFKFKFELL